MTNDLPSMDELAARLQAAFLAASGWKTLERAALLRHLMDLRADAEVEVNQMRCLQRAVRTSPALAATLEAHGFTNIAQRDTRRVDADTGSLIQAFNHLIEQGWEP
jgi:hypothetical protein